MSPLGIACSLAEMGACYPPRGSCVQRRPGAVPVAPVRGGTGTRDQLSPAESTDRSVGPGQGPAGGAQSARMEVRRHDRIEYRAARAEVRRHDRTEHRAGAVQEGLPPAAQKEGPEVLRASRPETHGQGPGKDPGVTSSGAQAFAGLSPAPSEGPTSYQTISVGLHQQSLVLEPFQEPWKGTIAPPDLGAVQPWSSRSGSPISDSSALRTGRGARLCRGGAEGSWTHTATGPEVLVCGGLRMAERWGGAGPCRTGPCSKGEASPNATMGHAFRCRTSTLRSVLSLELLSVLPKALH